MATRAFALPPRADLRRIAIVGGLALLALLLALHLAYLLDYVGVALRYPSQIDYGEGIVWQQMRDIMGGRGYGPLGVYPAVVYHYPPLYHAFSAWLAALAGLDELMAGRLVTLLSTLATVAMMGRLTIALLPRDDAPLVRYGCAAFTGLLFLSCYPVRMWTPLMRVDMLAGAWGLAGMLMTLRALDRPRWIYGAAVMFTLAMFTKQISIAPPIAAFGMMIVLRPWVAARGIAFGAVVSLCGLGAMMWATDGGFLRHLVGYNVNRIDLSLLTTILMPQLMIHSAIIGVGLVGAVMAWRLVRDRTDKATAGAAAAMLLLFVALKTVMLLSMMKSGSNYYYVVEWLSGVTMLAGLACAPWLRRAAGIDGAAPGTGLTSTGLPMACLMFGLLPLQLGALYLAMPDHGVLAELERDRAPIVRLIAASQRPVIADDMTLLLRAGKPVRWEPAITAELGATGVYDQAAFIALVHARCFGFFATEGVFGKPPSTMRYNPPVIAAIRAAYPVERQIGINRLHLPGGPVDPRRCAGVR